MNCTILTVEEEYAAEAERLDQMGEPIPEFMVVERVGVEATRLPSPAMAEIDDLLARFTSG